MATNKSSFETALIGAVEDQIRKEITKTFEAEKERIIKQMEEARDDIIAKAVLRISRHMDIQTANDRIIFTLDLREVKP